MLQGFPWPVPGLPVALLPCEEGAEQSSDAGQRTGLASYGSSFRNLQEAQLALRQNSHHNPRLIRPGWSTCRRLWVGMQLQKAERMHFGVVLDSLSCILGAGQWLHCFLEVMSLVLPF